MENEQKIITIRDDLSFLEKETLKHFHLEPGESYHVREMMASVVLKDPFQKIYSPLFTLSRLQPYFFIYEIGGLVPVSEIRPYLRNPFQ